MSDELRFDDRVAIVTGAGRGIGRAHAVALAERGARVVVNDLGGTVAGPGDDPGPAGSVAEEIVAAGGEAVANTADVTDVAGAASIVADAIDRWGRLDVVVNNAGNIATDGIDGLTDAQFARHLAIHVTGSMNVTRAAWPQLVAQRYGRVVLTTSIGLFGGPILISYATAKGAVLSLGRSFALAGEHDGIKVNLLAPAAETRMVTDPELRASSNIPPLPENAEPAPGRGVDQVPAMLLVLAHERCPTNGELLVAGLGRFARIFLAETPGIVAPGLSAEGVLDRWEEIVDEAGHVVPRATRDSITFREALIS